MNIGQIILGVTASALIVAAVVVAASRLCVRNFFREKRDHLRIMLTQEPNEDFRNEKEKEK